uniref:Uncharacterized protein n=1 Tax=Panagrolaimus sp. PS1159 TaxID=55785 RepID=A0AC35GIJ6_9BILA
MEKIILDLLMVIGKLLNGILVGRQSGDAIPCGPFSPKGFVQSITACFSCTKMKAFILKVFEVDSPEYSSNIEFCNQIKAQLYKANPKLSCYFISFDHYWLSSMLIAANLTLEIDEFLLMAIVSTKTMDVFELKFTDTGYLITDKRMINIDREGNHRNTILGNCNPKKVIIMNLSANNSTMTSLKNVLKSRKLISMERNRVENDERFCQEITNWILDKKQTKFYILPTCSRKYIITDKTDGTGTQLLAADNHESLPFLKSCIISRTTQHLSMSYIDVVTGKPKVIDLKKFGRKCHQYNITLNIKSKNAPVCQAEPIILPHIESLPQGINPELAKAKTPVIGFFDQSSVICLWNESKHIYEFLSSWNGKFGNDLFLNFEQEKPLFGQKAFELFQTQPASAVYDLIKIMSMPPDNFKVNPDWSFEIIKDAEYPIVLDFVTHDGSRKVANPSFLMAVMLKEHVKAIKNEIGKKPETLGFCLLNEFNKTEEENIKKQIQEACALLSIECLF